MIILKAKMAEVNSNTIIDTKTVFCNNKAVLERCLIMDLALIIHLADCDTGEMTKFLFNGDTTTQYLAFNHITGQWTYVGSFPIPLNKVITSYEYVCETYAGKDERGKYVKSLHSVILTFGDYSVAFECLEDEDYTSA
jgi:hypothetical protein